MCYYLSQSWKLEGGAGNGVAKSSHGSWTACVCVCEKNGFISLRLQAKIVLNWVCPARRESVCEKRKKMQHTFGISIPFGAAHAKSALRREISISWMEAKGQKKRSRAAVPQEILFFSRVYLPCSEPIYANPSKYFFWSSSTVKVGPAGCSPAMKRRSETFMWGRTENAENILLAFVNSWLDLENVKRGRAFFPANLLL